MIRGIGVDIVEIGRVEALLERFGERFVRRILNEREIQAFRQRGSNPSFLASRFAAKEAASKAMGTGIAQGVGFHDIEVANDSSGRPGLSFDGAARRVCQRLDVTRTMLSLSDERHYCVAMVVLESG